MNVIIIGGGISGVSAALRLKTKGIDSIIIEKNNILGGRSSSKKIILSDGREATFDIGAPHFSIKSDTWEEMVMFLISHFKVKISSRDSFYPPNTTYRSATKMQDLALSISSELNIVTNKKAVFLNPHSKTTEVITDTGDSYFGDAIIITTPMPEALKLFHNSYLEIPSKLKNNLAKMKYSKMLISMVVIDGNSDLPSCGFLPVNRNGIKYIIDNKKRGISDVTALTIAADERFSNENFDKPDNELMALIMNNVSEYINHKVLHSELHRWKYGMAESEYKSSFEYINAPTPFLLAGDGFVDRSIEGAFISGRDAANYLIKKDKDTEREFFIEQIKS